MDACAEHPCLNAGVCIDHVGEEQVNGFFRCICSEGWGGDVCDEPAVYEGDQQTAEGSYIRVPETCSNFVDLIQWIDAVQVGSFAGGDVIFLPTALFP